MKKVLSLLIVSCFCTQAGASTISLQREAETIKVYPYTTLTLYVVTDTPLWGLDIIVNVTADANITSAMGEADSEDYGWAPPYTYEPVFSPDYKQVEMGAAAWWTNYETVVAYVEITCGSTDTVVSIAEGWDFGGSMDHNYRRPSFSNGVVTISPYSGPLLTLTLEVEPNDVNITTVTPGLGPHQYYETEVISISAEPFTACPDVYRLDHWEGDGIADPNAAETAVYIDQNKTITAVYAADERWCGDECHPILQGDLNSDCYTNFDDYAIYSSMWLECTHPDCD
ncbi:MAG: hypothetical protein ACYTEL_06520 [Planctomycetota bacterium]